MLEGRQSFEPEFYVAIIHNNRKCVERAFYCFLYASAS